MSTFLIRHYKSADETSVIELWKICGLVVSHNDPAKDITRKLKVDSEWFLVGECEDIVVATCMVGYDGHRGCVNYLAIHPEHQGCGYGRRLMEKAEEILKNEGCPKVNLLVRNSNTEVLSFYDTLGYSDNQCISLGKRLISDQPE